MKFKQTLFLSVLVAAMAVSCTGKENPDDGGNGGSSAPAGNIQIKFTPDRSSFLKNPMTGG